MSSRSQALPAVPSRAATRALFDAPLRHGALRLRLAETEADLAAALRLRALTFRHDPSADDSDDLDARCHHIFIEREDRAGELPLAAIRCLILDHPAAGYAGRFYDLPAAEGLSLEIGRLCLHPEQPATEAMPLIWGALARLVDGHVIARMMGCTSFHGTDPARFAPALGHLALKAVGPEAERPRRKPELETRGLEDFAPFAAPKGVSLLPGLLRSYLALGGWVSDHLVIDRDLGTFHLYTCVPIATMPESRKRLYRAMA